MEQTTEIQDETAFVSKFGDPELSAFYQRLKRMSYDHEAFKICGVELTEARNTLTVCNLVRVVRDNRTNAVTVEEVDRVAGRWKKVLSSPILHDIPLWPVTNLRSDAGVWLIQKVMKRLHEEAGVAELRAAEKAAVETRAALLMEERGVTRQAALREVLVEQGKRPTSRTAIRYFHERMFGTGGRTKKGKASKSHGKVGSASVYNGMKALRTAFHRHIREPELFRAVLSTNHKAMSLADYVYFASNRKGVLKVWQERKNLIPLLRAISPKYWHRDELFARKSWVGEGCLVTGKRFGTGRTKHLTANWESSGPFRPFADNAAFQWLAKSKNTVVKKWNEKGREPWLADFMVKLRLPKGVTAPLLCHVMEEIAERQYQLLDNHRGAAVQLTDERVLAVFRAYVAHWEEIRRRDGYRQMAMRLFREFQGGTSEVFDFLKFHGFERGIPERNATWMSLQRRSREWHAVHGGGHVHNDFGWGDEKGGLDPETSWEFAVGAATIDECTVTPISTVREMRLEGMDMKHCVGGYAATCAAGNYRAYHITEPDGRRSTLGISIRRSDRDAEAVFDQVYGPTNTVVSERANTVAREMVLRYRNALRAAEKETAA